MASIKNPNAQKFWSTVDSLAEIQNISLSDLARKANIPVQTMMQSKSNCSYNVRISTILKMCNVLKTKPSCLGLARNVNFSNKVSLSKPFDGDKTNIDDLVPLLLLLSSTQQKAVLDVCLSYFNTDFRTVKIGSAAIKKGED